MKTLTKATYLQLVQEFKDGTKNNDFRPTRNSYGTKFTGELHFIHYVFYALLRQNSLEKTTHDVNSDKYQYVLAALKVLGNNTQENNTSLYRAANKVDAWEYTSDRNTIISSLLTVFPSLNEDIIQEVCENHFSAEKAA
jgi:hypothetical protein